MWFRNLRLYRFTAPFSFTPEALHDRLETDAFRPCGSLETSTLGWVSPLGRRAAQLAHGAAGAILICARKEERVLPSAVVGEALAEKVNAIEEAEGRPVRRKERQALKEELVQQMLPRAFTKASRCFAYIDPESRWLVVDAASSKRAEELITLLRRSLGSLPAVPPQVNEPPAVVMSAWVSGQRVPELVELGDECELKEPTEQGGVVRVKRLDLRSEEIATHLEAGRRVVKLALRFDGRLRFLLDEELAVRRLTFEDTVLESLEDIDREDELALLDAQFALMKLELGRFLPQLLSWFGGEQTGASAA